MAQIVMPISETFVTVDYQDVRNKYMNLPDVNEMSPQFWWTKLREYSKMGISYIKLVGIQQWEDDF